MRWDRGKLVREVGKAPGETGFLCVYMVRYASFCHKYSVQKGKMLQNMEDLLG